MAGRSAFDFNKFAISFSSSLTLVIWLLVVIFNFEFFNRLRLSAGRYKIPAIEAMSVGCNYHRFSMTSKFTLKSIFPLVCIAPLIFGLSAYTYFTFDTTKTPPPLHGTPLILLLTFSLIWLFFGEFRNKMIKVELDDTFVTIKKFGGLSSGKKYLYQELDGFKTSILSLSATDNEYLYFIQDGKKIGKLSGFYHKNYIDMKNEIESKLKDLGFEKFSYTDELKEIFS